MTQTTSEFLKLMAFAQERALNEQELEYINTNVFGLDRTLGVKYTHLSNGCVKTCIEVGAQHLQPAGLVNGGVYCSLTESTASVASMVATGGAVVGVNNSTDLIASVREGFIEAEATPIQIGRRTQLWSVEMFNNERLVARGTLRTMSVAK